MRTVADFISAGASLRVACRNCDREHYFRARFLKARFGYTVNVFDIPFVCSKCKCRRVSLASASDAAAEQKLSRMAAFGGVYAKYED